MRVSKRPKPTHDVTHPLMRCKGVKQEGSGFRVWGLGLRVWGLGFGVWGLGLGTQGRSTSLCVLGTFCVQPPSPTHAKLPQLLLT